MWRNINKTRKFDSDKYGEHHFTFAAAILWNGLPLRFGRQKALHPYKGCLLIIDYSITSHFMNMERNHCLEEGILLLLMSWECEDMQAQLPQIQGELPAHSAPSPGM
jgi:hypothetical protein